MKHKLFFQIALTFSFICLQPLFSIARNQDFESGMQLLEAKDYKAAMLKFENVIKSMESNKDFGSDYEIALNNLALCYNLNFQYVRAEVTYRKLISMIKRRKGVPDGVAEGGLAKALLNQKKFAQAEIFYKSAVSIFDRRFGADHPIVRQYLVDLETCLRSSNRTKEADEIESRIKQIPKIPGLN